MVPIQSGIKLDYSFFVAYTGLVARINCPGISHPGISHHGNNAVSAKVGNNDLLINEFDNNHLKFI